MSQTTTLEYSGTPIKMLTSIREIIVIVHRIENGNLIVRRSDGTAQLASLSQS